MGLRNGGFGASELQELETCGVRFRALGSTTEWFGNLSESLEGLMGYRFLYCVGCEGLGLVVGGLFHFGPGF